MAQQDPGEERQRLARLYSEKWDDELRELAAGFTELTEPAQQALRDEMKKRGLGDPNAPPPPPAPFIPRQPDHNDDNSAPDGEPERDYTWKTVLCECETQEQAWQLSEALRRSGIESWIEGGNRYSWDLGRARLQVPADQLDHAQAIAARPIPQEIVDEWNDRVSNPEEFELPHCPTCGAPDPILAAVEPVNTWECELCGHEWSDSSPDGAPD
jgi:hypothetical protein